jgi:hypothetical protein
MDIYAMKSDNSMWMTGKMHPVLHHQRTSLERLVSTWDCESQVIWGGNEIVQNISSGMVSEERLGNRWNAIRDVYTIVRRHVKFGADELDAYMIGVTLTGTYHVLYHTALGRLAP